MANQSHILVVEDDPLICEVVIDALDGIYQTSRAETAAAALEHLRAGGIDAMLLDCTLPGGIDPHLVPMADKSGSAGHPDVGSPRQGGQFSRRRPPIHPEAVQPDRAAGHHRAGGGHLVGRQHMLHR